MPETDQRYGQYHGQHIHHEQQIRGYDEDWDDDVYYAASGAPTGDRGSSIRAKASDQGDDKDGQDRVFTKRHYMKVPNVRQLRAMRSTAASISTGVLHSREGPSSPRGSPDTDLGDMALSSSASASGEGGLPHQLTSSPSMPSTPREGELADAGTTEGSNDRANSAEGPEEPDPRADSALPHHAALESGVNTNPDSSIDPPRHLKRRAEATADRPAGNDCLVQLRGSSPRSAINRHVGLSGSSFYQGSPTRAKSFPTLDPEERNERLRCLQTGPLSPGGGREGREGFRVGKRRRPPTTLDAGQRLGQGAWPKLPGEQSPSAKNSRSLGMNAHGTEYRRDVDESALHRKRGWSPGSASVVEDGHQQARERERPSSSGSSSSLSATPASDGDFVASDGSHAGAGAVQSSHQNGGRDMSVRRPSVLDRPARWASKGGATSWRSSPSLSTLRPPGGKARPHLTPRGSSSGGVISPASGTKERQSRRSLGLRGRVAHRGRGAERRPLAEEKEGRTLKLASVFQAPSGSSLRLRAKRGHNYLPPGRGDSSQHPVVVGGWGGNSISNAPSFDPTCMGASARSAEHTEEVEEVVSDEAENIEGAFGGDPCSIIFKRRGTGRGVEVMNGVVDEFEEQLLGEDEDADGRAGGAGRLWAEVGRGSDRATEEGAEGDGAGSPSGGRAVKSRGESQDVVAYHDGRVVVDVAMPVGGAIPRATSTLGGQASLVSPPCSPTQNVRGDHNAAAPARATSSVKKTPTQQQQGAPKDPSPPPRTPVSSGPRGSTFTPSSFKRGPSSSASASGGHGHGQGKWRPSFGGGRDDSAARSPGSMHAPRAVFCTPARFSGEASAPGSWSASASGSTRRRGGGAGNGYLGKLLQQVRARFDGDEARLLSGEFPFRQSSASAGGNATRSGGKYIDREGGSSAIGRRDHGDPRTRCRVALDVTVLPFGSELCSARGGAAFGGNVNYDRSSGSAGLARFPCFVHEVVNVSTASDRGGTSAGASVDAECDGSLLKQLRVLHGTRVDALFKHDTRRALDVGAGSQLRIYDPCCVSHSDAKERGPMLMCTQLCEPFPACFSPLPEPPDRFDSRS